MTVIIQYALLWYVSVMHATLTLSYRDYDEYPGPKLMDAQMVVMCCSDDVQEAGHV